jgi:hypothetical protein
VINRSKSRDIPKVPVIAQGRIGVRNSFENGKRLMGSIRFDEGRFPVVVTVDLTNEWNCFVELIHLTRDEQRRVPIITNRVQLTSTQPTFGGRRWWFLCPRTARRTTKLFLPNGGWHFWSRQAYGLGYRCQREDRFSRLQRRAATLNRQLGGEGLSTWADPPAKPKWMRWRTYEKKFAAWERIVERANRAFTTQTMRIVRPPAVSIRIGRSRRL